MKNALYFAVFSQKKPCIFDLDHYNTRHISDAGWSSLVARRAHNPKAVGSNPAPATKFKASNNSMLFSFRFFHSSQGLLQNL